MRILSKLEAEQHLVSYMPDDIIMLHQIFLGNNYKLYLVGGCIRDTFLGKIPKDYDVCTNAMPDEVIRILKANNINCDLRGEHFAVGVALMESGEYEIATFREDIKTPDSNRHPEVRLGVTIEQDCMRRDFTINALFMDIDRLEIIDFIAGINDLENGVVRCVGNPIDRFNEDHLRKMRAVVRCVSDDFGIHMDTFNSIVINPELNISNERIMWELKKAYDKALDKKYLVDILYKSKLIDHIFKGLLPKDFNRIDFTKIVSFNTFIAAIINSAHYNISKKLVAINYPVKIANSVEFLYNDAVFLHPMTFHSKRKSTDLTDEEILAFRPDKISQYMVDFKPTEGLAQEFMDKGLFNAELGRALDKYYLDHFLGSI